MAAAASHSTSAFPVPFQACLAMVGAVVASAFRIPLSQLMAAEREGATISGARQIAAYLAHVGFGLTYSQVGRTIGRHRSTVRHACAQVEDRRDCPRLDRALSALEAAARTHALAVCALCREA